MIANGRRRFSPTPPASTIGSTGRTHGETAVISPATNAKTIARTIVGYSDAEACPVVTGFVRARLRGSAGSLPFCSAPLWSACAARGRLLLAPAAPAAARMRLRRGQVVGERGRDLGDRAELLARRLEVAGSRAACSPRPRRAARRRCAIGSSFAAVDELGRVLLVPVAARVRERAEQPLRLGVLGARLAVEHLAHRAREPPRPAGEDLVGRVGLALADRPQQDAHALDAVLLPRRRLRDERDEVVEARRGRPASRRGRRAPSAAAAGSGSRPRR